MPLHPESQFHLPCFSLFPFCCNNFVSVVIYTFSFVLYVIIGKMFRFSFIHFQKMYFFYWFPSWKPRIDSLFVVKIQQLALVEMIKMIMHFSMIIRWVVSAHFTLFCHRNTNRMVFEWYNYKLVSVKKASFIFQVVTIRSINIQQRAKDNKSIRMYMMILPIAD